MITTLARYSVEDILPLIGFNKGKHTFDLPDGRSFRVSMGSSRLECFKRNLECVWCGLPGDTFLLQLPPNTERPHLNLFGRQGHTLMTRDHIIPLSRGGPNNIDNLQTMCTKCNVKKDSLLSLEFVLKMTQWKLPIPKVQPEPYNIWPLWLEEGNISDI